jgi:hypothetical protein
MSDDCLLLLEADLNINLISSIILVLYVDRARKNAYFLLRVHRNKIEAWQLGKLHI